MTPPHQVMLMRSLMADLARIKTANAFDTDTRTVRQPDYPPPDSPPDMEKEPWNFIMGEPAPALLVWLDGETDDETGVSTMKDRPLLSVFMLGMIRDEKGLQEKVQTFSADVRQVLRSNMNRVHPTAPTADVGGVMTRITKIGYFYPKSKTGAMAMFSVEAEMSYNAPRNG